MSHTDNILSKFTTAPHFRYCCNLSMLKFYDDVLFYGMCVISLVCNVNKVYVSLWFSVLVVSYSAIFPLIPIFHVSSTFDLFCFNLP